MVSLKEIKDYKKILVKTLKNKCIFLDVFGPIKVLKENYFVKLSNVYCYDKHPYFLDYVLDKEKEILNIPGFGDRFIVPKLAMESNAIFKSGYLIDNATINDAAQRYEVTRYLIKSAMWRGSENLNKRLSVLLVENAGTEVKNITDVLEIFTIAKGKYMGSIYSDLPVAYVSENLYWQIIDKYNAYDIKECEDFYFKGIKIILNKYLSKNIDIMFAPKNMGICIAGINTLRLIQPEFYDGYELQMHFSAGVYLPKSKEFKDLIITGKLKEENQ